MTQILDERERAMDAAGDLYSQIRALEKQRADVMYKFIENYCVVKVGDNLQLRVGGTLRTCVVRERDLEVWYHVLDELQPVKECYPAFSLTLDPLGRNGEQDGRYTGTGNIKRTLYFSPKHGIWLINGQRPGDTFGVELGVGGMIKKPRE